MRPIITIHRSKQAAIEHGHPWIYPKAILSERGDIQSGVLVEVHDEQGLALGVGMYNAHSLYRIRLLAHSQDSVDHSSLEAIVLYRLKQAVDLRTALRLPNKNTNAYRVFNSEADGLSGLTVDRLGETYVIAVSAYWIMAQKNLVERCLQQIFNTEHFVWRMQTKALKQDGWLISEANISSGKSLAMEAGICFQIDFATAQKTGLFLDQRENHQRIASLAEGKRVLDLYSYTGGFALHAAKAGATWVTAVDSSQEAIMTARNNAKINHCEQIEFIEADARDYLNKAGEYDIVILDPPKLVPSKRDLTKAKNYYRFLHREVLKQMRSGALLMTCNCSAALSAKEFLNLVHHQAQWCKRTIRLLGIYGPAKCHPLLPGFPEGNYLTAILVAVF